MNDKNAETLAVFSRLVSQETSRYQKLLEPYQSEDAEFASAGSIEQMTRILGEVSARLSVIEQAAELGFAFESDLFSKPRLFGTVSLDVDTLDIGGLHGLEQDNEGNEFRWTRVKEISFELPVNRIHKKRLQIYFSHIVKKQYRRQAKITIDGCNQKHKLRRTRSGFCWECEIPPFTDLATTKVTVSIPEVHAPSELGHNDDTRLLGFAISKIVADDPTSKIKNVFLRN